MTAFGVIPLPADRRPELAGQEAFELGPLGLNRITWGRHLACNSGLPAAARCVGLVLALYTDDSATMPAYLSLAELAGLTGLPERDVRRYLRMLEGDGWVSRHGRTPGYPTARWLSWPVSDQAALRRAQLAEAAR